MNSIIEFGSVQGNPLYNCSAKSAEQWSIDGGIKRPFLGWMSLIYGITIEILYFPCLGAIIKRGLLNNSCYKILLILASCDMAQIALNSIITGFLYVKGAVFCSYPEKIYFFGMCVLYSWMLSCSLTLLLVINRILELFSPAISAVLFKKNRTWMLIAIPGFYCVFFTYFTTPPIFNSKMMSWASDAFIYTNRSNSYVNNAQKYNNIIFVIATVILYTIYSFGSYIFYRKLSHNLKTGRIIFMQSSVICTLNCSAAAIYVLMMYIELYDWILLLGDLTWCFAHGAPAIMYLTTNRSIRSEVISWFPKKNKNIKVNPLSNTVLQSMSTSQN